jgi:glycosyltransferase involved in cell wall biosynthesis
MTAPGTAPSLSVVVAAWNEVALLRACLQSLVEEQSRSEHAPFEIIVVGDLSPGRREMMANEFSSCVFVPVERTPAVPTLRKTGLSRATGDVVAFIEDHATVAPEWADALREAFSQAEVVAAGGPVGQGAGSSALDWGAYLFDYGRFAPPQPRGVARQLSGLNMAFRRGFLAELDELLGDGVFEGPLHTELARRNERPVMAPAAIVYHNKRYSLRQAFVSVYYLGRGYGGRRVESASRVMRFVRAASCIALPAVLVWRPLSAALRNGRVVGPVLGSLGYLSLLALSWSSGECIGYLFGRGDSDSRWR